MNVGGVSSAASYSVNIQVVQVSVTALPPATQTSVSRDGSLLGQLDGLAKESPAKFKTVMEEIAARLTAQAGLAEGHRAGLLTELARRFTAAGKAGSLAALSEAAPTSTPPAAPTGATTGTTTPAATTASTPVTPATTTPPVTTAPPTTTPPPARHHHKHHQEQRHEGERREEQGHGGRGLGAVFSLVADVIRSVLEAAAKKPATPVAPATTGTAPAPAVTAAPTAAPKGSTVSLAA